MSTDLNTGSSNPSATANTAGAPARTVKHEIRVDADPASVFTILADVTRWPLYFPPTVRAERVSGDDREEEIRLWAMANDELRTWTSRRVVDRQKRSVLFRQTRTGPPVAAMTGEWVVDELAGGASQVSLFHTYRAVDDDPGMLAQIERAVDTNSRSELTHLRAAAERAGREPELLMDFCDTVSVTASRQDAYEFIYAAGLWPERLPHVAALELTENVPGLQRLVMDTRSPDGSLHRTVSGRVCEPPSGIVYKQTVLPPVLVAHIGQWSFVDQPDGGVTVTSHHQVILDPDGIAALPQPPTSLAEARAAVRHALGTNSRGTLAALRAFVMRP